MYLQQRRLTLFNYPQGNQSEWFRRHISWLQSLKHLMEAHQKMIDCGGFHKAWYPLIAYALVYYCCGLSLPPLAQDLRKYTRIMQDCGQTMHIQHTLPLQQMVSNEMAGRVFAVVSSVGNISIPVSTLIYGILLTLLSPGALFIGTGLILLPLSLFSFVYFRNLEKEKPISP